MKRSLTGVLAFVALMPLATSCAMNKAEKGATIGVVGGAAVGAAIGKATGNTVRGAIIGAAVGGIAGGLIGHEMDKHAAELAYDLPGATVQRIGEGIVVTFPDGLLFGYDSDALTPEARDNFRRFAASMKKYPNSRTLIVGHTDSDGTAVYNQDLSDRRSLSAADYVVSEGIARSRVSTAGRGEYEPIATNGTDDGRRLNRRVEIAIYTNAAAGSSSGN